MRVGSFTCMEQTKHTATASEKKAYCNSLNFNAWKTFYIFLLLDEFAWMKMQCLVSIVTCNCGLASSCNDETQNRNSFIVFDEWLHSWLLLLMVKLLDKLSTKQVFQSFVIVGKSEKMHRRLCHRKKMKKLHQPWRSTHKMIKKNVIPANFMSSFDRTRALPRRSWLTSLDYFRHQTNHWGIWIMLTRSGMRRARRQSPNQTL